jgi:hypothetical protein
MMHADRLRMTIVSTVKNFYKQPSKIKREENVLSDDSREGLSPIRDLVNAKGPLA